MFLLHNVSSIVCAALRATVGRISLIAVFSKARTQQRCLKKHKVSEIKFSVILWGWWLKEHDEIKIWSDWSISNYVVTMLFFWPFHKMFHKIRSQNELFFLVQQLGFHKSFGSRMLFELCELGEWWFLISKVICQLWFDIIGKRGLKMHCHGNNSGQQTGRKSFCL